MAKEDWAIVVGITRYSDPVEYPPLYGPENDAKSFRDWLIDPEGGDVPEEQVKLIVSSQYPPRAARAKKDPSELAVERAFKKYDTISMKSIAAWRSPRVGRRLYLYMAGHGFEIPSDSEGSSPERYVVLMTANATKTQVGHHLAGRLWADKYLNPRLFDEVILLMDCCRQDLLQVPLRRPPGKTPPPIVPDEKVRWLYAFGALPRQNTYEKRFDSKVGGVFTRTLLRGLKGAASEANGNITAGSLRNHMEENMRNLLSPEERADATLSRWPEVTSSPAPERFLIAHAPPMKYQVDFGALPGDEGKKLSILVWVGSTSSTVFEAVVDATRLVTTSLLKGYYKWELGERGQTFEVSDTEEVIHVKL